MTRMRRSSSTFFGLLFLSTLLACSVVVDVVECEDNDQCVLEDGTQLVCTSQNVCVDAPAVGDECVLPRECLAPQVCVAPDPEQEVGFCTLDCTAGTCDDPAVPDGWVCCELDDGSSACLEPSLCSAG